MLVSRKDRPARRHLATSWRVPELSDEADCMIRPAVKTTGNPSRLEVEHRDIAAGTEMKNLTIGQKNIFDNFRDLELPGAEMTNSHNSMRLAFLVQPCWLIFQPYSVTDQTQGRDRFFPRLLRAL